MRDYLTHPDWNPEVRHALNAFIEDMGKDSPSYDPSVYVVSDSDNTISIFDVEHQLAVYQLQKMAFAFSKEEIDAVLRSGLTDFTSKREGYVKDGTAHSYEEWITDIAKAYAYLSDRYGPFTPKGLSSEDMVIVQQDPMWMEFACKMRGMYSLLTKHENGSVSCSWLLAWFCGMSEQEVYDLAYESHAYYSSVNTSKVTWTSGEVPGSHFIAEVTWISGIQVTENIRELFRVLHEQGIAVWVCSASGTDPIRAVIDYFGLHEYVEGLMAMTMKLENGVYGSEYDFENGKAWLAEQNGVWRKDTCSTKAQTQLQGKVTAIENVVVPRKKHGPAAGFGDSSGDFPFCTQFKSMKTAVCFNRADRTVEDGGGLMAELAVYQKDVLQYDYPEAQKNNDILYLLQGREENGKRSLRNSRMTVRLGETEEKLFADERNEKTIALMKEKKMTTEEAIRFFSEKTGKDKTGFAFGFAEEPAQYRIRK